MIGQNNLLNKFRTQIETGIFPRFVILCGTKGSGKKLFSIEVGKMLTDGNTVFIEPKVDNIREMISTAYKVTLPTLYVIADADNMSPAARNAMLKVVEEPPNNAYFIMTLISPENTLPTIRSRAFLFHTDPYSEEELNKYFYENYANQLEVVDIVLRICETPGEIDQIMRVNVEEFYAFVEKVVDYIAEVSISNAFKLDTNIAFKEDATGYDLTLFYKAFMAICLNRMKNSTNNVERFQYSRGIVITSKALQELKSVSLNKQYNFDVWLLNIRGAWE